MSITIIILLCSAILALIATVTAKTSDKIHFKALSTPLGATCFMLFGLLINSKFAFFEVSSYFITSISLFVLCSAITIISLCARSARNGK